MQMSTRGRYALRAMFELAMCKGNDPISLNYLSKTESISRKYLGQLFIKLRRAGLITSVRGPKGGYLLSRDPKSISVGDIIRATESTIAPVYCVDENAESHCDREEKCVCHLYWERLEKQIVDFLDSYTLFDLCGEAKREKTPPHEVKKFRV